MKSRFEPFPELRSARIRLRQMTEADLPEILSLRSNEVVNKYIGRPQPVVMKDAEAHLNLITNALKTGESIEWGICLNTNSKMIGTICYWNFSDDRLKAEIGYALHPDFHGKGLMSEAMKSVLEYGFGELQLTDIEAFTHCENEASKNLLMKHGFKQNISRKDDENKDLIIFEISRNTYSDQD